MTQSKQQQRGSSDFTFYDTAFSSRPLIQQQPDISQQFNQIDQAYFLSIGNLAQELSQLNAEHQKHYRNSPKKYAPIKKQELEKVFKYFRKYEPLYFNKMIIRELSHKYKKGVAIKKQKEGYYFGEVTTVQNQEGDKVKVKHGRGVLVYDLFHKGNGENKRVYEGEWLDDQKSGLGFEMFTDGSVYHGFYVGNQPHGRGKFTNGQGEMYEGEWINGTKHGKGFWQGVRGQTYMGEWKQNKPQGYGILVNQKGDRYEGEFKNSMKHGQGIERFINGDLYKGQYQNDRPCGFGEYYWKNKSYFKGYFANGLRSGQGLWKKHPGVSDKYQGQYQSDKKWGYGTFTWANGNYFKGNYSADFRNGYGQMYWTNGNYYKGQWKDGLFHGKGQLFITNEGLRIGTFQNNQIVNIDYEQPIEDYQNQQNSRVDTKQSQIHLLRNVSKVSNMSVKSNKSKKSVLSKHKTLYQEKRPRSFFNNQHSQLSLNSSQEKPSNLLFSSQGGMRSVPLKKLIENTRDSQNSRYMAKSNHEKVSQGFRITQKTPNNMLKDQSLKNSRNSAMQRRPNRILHSSFYLYKFRNNMRRPQNQSEMQNKSYVSPYDNGFVLES